MVKVHAIRTGLVQVREAQRQRHRNGLAAVTDMLFDLNWTEWLPVYAWAIEHVEGIIVVDTGETARVHETGYHPPWHPFYRRAVHFSVHPDEEIGPQLRTIGISPRDVRQVILTHLHTDHAGGLAHLTGSRFWVSEGEWKSANCFAGRLQGYLPHRWPKWWQPEFIRFEDGPVGPFHQSMAITRRGDVRIVPTPGHTPNHVSVFLDGEPAVFLAGDTSYSQSLLLSGKIDGVSLNPAVAHETGSRILALAKERPLIYLPSHDADAERRLHNLSILANVETSHSKTVELIPAAERGSR
ncbi:MAG: N-acyl homoserine lactonase family protein [Acidobacteria bacterium]|nr:N-acyl homoserine lactonase family protein [Acidobacteriota bacterium]